MVFKKQRFSPVCQMLAMAICQWTYSPPAKDDLDAETPGLKGEEKVSDRNSQKPSRNANLAEFSRKNNAKFCSSKCAFRCSENDIFFNNVRFASTVPGPPDSFCWWSQS